MEQRMISTNMANGTIHFTDRSDRLSDTPWVKHPTFEGVYLKHMIRGDDTEGLFSSHLVKIDPHACLESHVHENQLELHEVLEGNGSCQLCSESFDYHLGKSAVISKGHQHRVQAGEKGLTLLAKFFPASL